MILGKFMLYRSFQPISIIIRVAVGIEQFRQSLSFVDGVNYCRIVAGSPSIGIVNLYILVGQFFQVKVLLGIEHMHSVGPYRWYTKVAIVRNAGWAAGATFGGNEYYAVGAAGVINGGGRSIF